jgi:hypothetical protein
MLTRLSALLRDSIRKFRQKWWLWMSYFVVETFRERIFSFINRYLDRHSGWIASSLSLLMHSWTGIWITIFGGTILVLVILSFIDTRPVATKPVLTIPFGNWRSGGLYDLQENLIGWELAISNTETRFHTIANNVQAKITFRHTLGNTFTVNPAAWLLYDPKRALADRVSIGMGEVVRLLVCVAVNNAVGHYAASPPWPFQIDAKHRLEYGEWNVQIELLGDNVKSTYEGTLTLNANGVADLKMER